MKYFLIISALILLLLPVHANSIEKPDNNLTEGFVYIDDIIPDIKVELKYITTDNFIGKQIDGYVKPKCILSKQAALALKKVQYELSRFGLALKIFDGYRPQRAVNHFVRWAKDKNDKKQKQKYYPNVNKSKLFKLGYIATRSGHSRGSTVDLTICAKTIQNTCNELDMGTPFDFFSDKSWTESHKITPQQSANRMLLKIIMQRYGFIPYKKEWWHFTLRNEPFKKKYYDFEVK